jgi:hypothetical protein
VVFSMPIPAKERFVRSDAGVWVKFHGALATVTKGVIGAQNCR